MSDISIILKLAVGDGESGGGVGSGVFWGRRAGVTVHVLISYDLDVWPLIMYFTFKYNNALIFPMAK